MKNKGVKKGSEVQRPKPVEPAALVPAVGRCVRQQWTVRVTPSDRRTLERGYFDAKYIDLLLDEHARGRRDHSYPLWTLWMLELWHRKYIDAATAG